MQLDRKTKAEVARLSREIAVVAAAGLALPGTLSERRMRCGRANCRCKAEPPILHGPYWSWTRKIENKTVTRYLNEQERADAQPLFENAKRLRSLIVELETLGLSVFEAHSPAKQPARRSR